MIYAVGLPGQMPRVWVETGNIRQAEAQMKPGETLAPAQLGEDGNPIPEPLPQN